MSSDPQQNNNPEQNKDEADSRYAERYSIYNDLMDMDEVPSVPEKSAARSGKNNNENEDDPNAATAVYNFEQIKENLSKSGIKLDDGADFGETEAVLPIKDTEGFHIAILAPGERVRPFIWPEGIESISVGRDKLSVEIFINDNRVSRVHLQIKRIDDENLEVIDLGSTNHSYMGQGDELKPYVPTAWKFNDIIVVGRTRLILRRGIPHT